MWAGAPTPYSARHEYGHHAGEAGLHEWKPASSVLNHWRA